MQLWWMQHRWKIHCRTWYLFVTLPVGVVGLVSFWRGRSVTCQCWILEFGFIFSVALLKYYFRLWSLELFLQIFFFSVALPTIFWIVEFIFHLQEMGLLDKVHLELLLWIVCLSRLFIKLYLWIFCLLILFNKIIIVDCLSVDSEIFRKSGNSSNNFHNTCNANWYVPQWLFDALYWRKIYSKKNRQSQNKHIKQTNTCSWGISCSSPLRPPSPEARFVAFCSEKVFIFCILTKTRFAQKTLHFCRRPAAWAVESDWDWSLRKDPATWSILSDLWTS